MERLYRELKSKRPAYILIYEEGGTEEPKRVEVLQGGRLRAQAAVDAASALEWSRIELYASDGSFLGAITPYDDIVPSAGPDLEHEARLLELMLKASNEASSRVERLFQPALSSLIEANRLLLERVQQLEEHYIESLDIMREAFISSARAQLAEEQLAKALEEQKEKEGLDGLAQIVMGAIGKDAIAPFIEHLLQEGNHEVESPTATKSHHDGHLSSSDQRRQGDPHTSGFRG